jgi:hypothetical protein
MKLDLDTSDATEITVREALSWSAKNKRQRTKDNRQPTNKKHGNHSHRPKSSLSGHAQLFAGYEARSYD